MKQKSKIRKQKFSTATKKKGFVPISVWNAELARKDGVLNIGQEAKAHTHKGLGRNECRKKGVF
jgi:hypothetical protein